jgi:Bardet-Biedl syndrome 9 protein
MVYRELSLVWAATTNSVAVAVSVDTFAKMPGLISTLDDEGNLVIQYLGTDPPASGGAAVDSSKEPNYEEMDDEHRRLLNVIREATSDTRVEPTERLMIRAQVPTSIDQAPQEGEMRQAQDVSDMYSATVTARVFINYRGGDSIENVVLTISVPPPFSVNQEQVVLPLLSGKAQTPAIVALTFKLSSPEVVSSKIATVMATYITTFGEPRSASAELVLPLCLMARVVAPLKNATHKLTIDCSRMPPPLSLLFEDMLTQQATFNPEQSSASSHILTFMYHNGIDVTILVSKNAGRIRLQSGVFEALWPVFQELSERLKLYFRSMPETGEEPFTISFSEAIPFPEVFEVVDQHLACRQRMMAISKTLSEGAHQFRSIQKRLLLRFKDRNPAPLQHLDTLLEETYQQLRTVGDEMEEKQSELRNLQNRLSAAINLLNHVVRFKFDLDDESFGVLETHISPNVIDNPEQGWEETTEASVTYLLRTVMAKGAKDSIGAVPQSMNAMTDSVKLKKHIQLVCDRLSKGVKLTKSSKKKEADSSVAPSEE